MRKYYLFIVLIVTIGLGIRGCSGTEKEQNSSNDFEEESKKIAESYRGIYEQMSKNEKQLPLSIVKQIVECLGDAGYVAVDLHNQINMTHFDKMIEFIKKVEEKKEDKITVIVVRDNGGFTRYDLETYKGKVDVTSSYVFWKGGKPITGKKKEYPVYAWEYTKEGYLFFEEYHIPGYDGESGHAALRVLPLREECRELNRRYIIPVGYDLNNLFLLNWSESDYGNVDFYDLFDILYSKVYKKPIPYIKDDNCGVGKIYQIPKEEFEHVIALYFAIDVNKLREKTKFSEVGQTYEYRPRGLYDRAASIAPYPETVGYVKNGDGTLSMTVNVVYPDKNSSKIFAHEVVIRPLPDGSFQYVSNRIIPSDENKKETWYTERLTEEQWEEFYGKTQ